MLANFLTVLVIVSVYNDISVISLLIDEGKCVKLEVELCSDINYNMTLMPNVKMNVDKMDEATRRVSEFSPLFSVKCYENFKFFICNMFLPICHTIDNTPTPVYPCRHVCEAARDGCEPLMKKYRFEWPEVLRCDFLSSMDDNALCGSPPDSKPTKPTKISRKTTRGLSLTTKPTWVQIIEKFPKGIDWLSSLKKTTNWNAFVKVFGGKNLKFSTICSMDPDSVYIKKDKKEYCAPRCENHEPFTSADVKFATVWISTWGIICFLSTALTVTTFLIDHKRFKYPERPIIFLSFCYNLYSIGYLIRAFGGYKNIICENSENGKHVVIEGMSVTSCTLVFFFLYFFGMASALWWVILSLTWFLSSALKWGHEAIEKYSSLFHAISWTVPTIQTIVALVTRKVDADKLSGLCYIGNTNSKDLLLFVALPLLIYLLIGTLFLCMGFVALVKIRKELRRERNTNKFERLVLRIGVFSVLYSVPASVVVGCFLHEYNRLKRMEEKTENIFACLTNENCTDDILPKPELFFLRYFMLLVVGVTSGVWIWTSKTLNSWRRFYAKKTGRDDPEERKKLYKQHQHQQQRQNRRSSSDGINPPSGVPSTAVTTLHGSSNHMNQQQHVYMPPPTRFFFPTQQTSTGFMQAHNVPISHAKIDSISRGYTVTPISNFDSDVNSQYDPTNHNYIPAYNTQDEISNPPPSKNYSRSSSDQRSVSQHSSQYNNGTLPRSTHGNQPGSPKSISTRSHRSNDDQRL